MSIQPARVKVASLKPLAGPRVHFVGEFEDPWDVATGEVELKNPDQAYYVVGGGCKAPSDNTYFSFQWMWLELEDMAKIIADLPVCLIQTHDDMETGLCPTQRPAGWEWSLAEAFTRLGMLPPVAEIAFPDVLDFPRSPHLVQYLIDAYRAGVSASVSDFQEEAERKLRHLDGVETLLGRW